MKTSDFELLSDWPDLSASVVGLVIQDHRGRYGLQFRDNFPQISGPGHWGCFGGHVEGDETLKVAAQREVQEELDITIPLDAFEPFARLVPENGLQKHHFYFRITQPITLRDIRLDEGAGFGFFELSQLSQYPLLESTQTIFDYIQRV